MCLLESPHHTQKLPVSAILLWFILVRSPTKIYSFLLSIFTRKKIVILFFISECIFFSAIPSINLWSTFFHSIHYSLFDLISISSTNTTRHDLCTPHISLIPILLTVYDNMIWYDMIQYPNWWVIHVYIAVSVHYSPPLFSGLLYYFWGW